MKTKKIIYNHLMDLYIEDKEGNFKVFIKIFNSFVNENQKKCSRKFSKNVIENMKMMNDENKFMAHLVLK